MANITVSKEARKDLVSIRQYIEDELCNPQAAQRIIGSLKKSILALESFPFRGTSAPEIRPQHSFCSSTSASIGLGIVIPPSSPSAAPSSASP